ncbi:MAG: SufD family Fe-S cluster assembly protein [Thermodesulfovibrionia bacterium]|nr:SufD family Fe-S cluster assembly protein [Thermodesulfovibrionia bacterium]
MPKRELKGKTKAAEKKSSARGPDIDIHAYSTKAKVHEKVKKLRHLSDEIKDKSLHVGIDTGEACRSGSFFQIDHSVILASAYQEGIEVMSSSEALKRYDWLSEYWWKAVKVDADKYTAEAEIRQNKGYFLRALPGARVDFPLQACLYMSEDGLAQKVHNIIIAEEGSELNIITGCAVGQKVKNGLHIGISEFYVKKNARVSFTMIHNWAEDVAVRPRSATIVEENGVFLSNYICIKPVKTLQMYPTAYCTGENATVRYYTILLAIGGSHMDVGSRVFLKARGSKAEVVTRAITEGGNIIARGHLIGEVPGIKAHLECRGLILSEQGSIHAIPELEGKVSDIDMSHEAAVGKIAAEEIQYLMARGLSSDEATAAIVRGFLDVNIKGLPENLEKEIKKAIKIEEKKERLL